MDWWPRDTVREVDVITGCFFMLRREGLPSRPADSTSGFSMYAGGSRFLCWLDQEAGTKTDTFCPEAQVIHLVRRIGRQGQPNRVYQINLGLLKLFAKHHGQAYARVANLLMWLFYATRVPLLRGAADLGLGNEETAQKAGGSMEKRCRGI